MKQTFDGRWARRSAVLYLDADQEYCLMMILSLDKQNLSPQFDEEYK
jgi:hypothetical protein